MKTKIIDGKKIKEELFKEIKEDIKKLSFTPVFCDILIGDSPVSAQYVLMKKNNAQLLGIKFKDLFLADTLSTQEVISEIQKINNLKNICGLIIQLPLPDHLDKQKILDAVKPEIDVDCLGSIASANFYQGNWVLGFPTALACLYLLDSLKIDLSLKNILVLGQGDLVGKPTFSLLKKRNLNVSCLDSASILKEEKIKEADIIISGIGNGNYINGLKIKLGAILIDAGTSESNSGIIGDVDLKSVNGIASFVSPVPGGVGPVTIAMLFRNILLVAKSFKKNK